MKFTKLVLQTRRLVVALRNDHSLPLWQEWCSIERMIGKLIGKSLVVGILSMTAAPLCFGQAPPPNDNFSNRVVLTGNTVAFSVRSRAPRFSLMRL